MNQILRNRSFVVVWLGNAISELGGAFGTFSNSVLIYQLTNSTVALGSMWLLYFVPSLILQLIIGPFIDKWSRKWTMIFAQYTRGVIFLLPLVSLFLGNLEIWHIYAVQIIVGLITPIYTPANQALTPTIVDKEQLSSANAYIDGTVRLMTFLAPILGGFVVQYVGVKITLSMVSILLFVSGTLLLLVKEEVRPQNIRSSWLNQFLGGMSFFFKQRIIVWLGVFLAFVQFAVGVTMVVNLPYITDELSGSYTDYGYFMAGFPLGYVIGSTLVGKVKYKSRRVLMLGSLVIGGLTFVSLGFNTSVVFAICKEVVAGIAMAFFSIHNMTLCQQVVPNNFMGQVSSVRLLIIRGAMPLGVLAGSFLGDMLGVRFMYFFIGSLISLVSLMGIALPYFKFIDDDKTISKIAS